VDLQEVCYQFLLVFLWILMKYIFHHHHLNHLVNRYLQEVKMHQENLLHHLHHLLMLLY
jgi:hypothetical protein